MDVKEEWLLPSELGPLEGTEQLGDTGATVRDFWIYAASDLRNNVLRGVLAEFLVARAVGAKIASRRPWDDYDVETSEGIRVEVKSSAYLQSWEQRQLSTIRFSGLTGRSWDATRGFGSEREVRAKVFVFAIQTCTVPEDYRPLDVDQWRFYVASASAIRENGARSVGMGFLTRYAEGPLTWAELRAAVVSAVNGPKTEAEKKPKPTPTQMPFKTFERMLVQLLRDAGHGKDVTRDEIVTVGNPYFERAEVEGYTPAKYAGPDARWLSESLQKRLVKALT